MNNNKHNYLKPSLEFHEQLEKLQGQGLVINDREFAISKLSNISYYRLSAYWLPFKMPNHSEHSNRNFYPNTTFDDILGFYEFDRKLRLLVMDAIERIEIAIKTKIANYLANKYGPFAHENPNCFHDKFEHGNWLNKLRNETVRSRERFIQHYKEKYLEFPVLPVWMATEIISFGSLSIMYKGLKNEDKRAISLSAFDLNPKTLTNWLHFLTYIRNICAHHGRLWNKEFAIRPKLEGLSSAWLPPVSPRNDRSFFALLILRYLLRFIGNDDKWKEACEDLLLPVLTKHEWCRSSMGMPNDWLKHQIWVSYS